MDKFSNGILSFLVLYAAIVTVSYVLDSARAAGAATDGTARLNEMLSKAQLDALRRQIEPHFLFTYAERGCGTGTARVDNDAAVGMIAGT